MSQTLAEKFYYFMKLGREFEVRCKEEYLKGNISGFLHLAIGEEAVHVEMFKKRDPIKLLVERSLKEGWLTEEQIRIIDQKVEAIVEESVQFALSSPEPSEEELYTDIYCGVCSDVIP